MTHCGNLGKLLSLLSYFYYTVKWQDLVRCSRRSLKIQGSHWPLTSWHKLDLETGEDCHLSGLWGRLFMGHRTVLLGNGEWDAQTAHKTEVLPYLRNLNSVGHWRDKQPRQGHWKNMKRKVTYFMWKTNFLGEFTKSFIIYSSNLWNQQNFRVQRSMESL